MNTMLLWSWHQVSILREYLEAYDQSNKLESKELQPFPKVNTYDCEFNEDAFTLERKIDIRMLRRRLFRLKNKVISSFEKLKLFSLESIRVPSNIKPI